MKRINAKVGKYIAFKLKLKGITCRSVAHSANLSTSIITGVLNSRKRSERAERAIAVSLGYGSFVELEEEAEKMVAIATGYEITGSDKCKIGHGCHTILPAVRPKEIPSGRPISQVKN